MKSRRGGGEGAAAEYMAAPQGPQPARPPPRAPAAMIPLLPPQSGTQQPLPSAALAREHFRDSMVPVATAAPRPSNGDARAGAAARPWGLALLTAGREAASAALPASRCAGAAGALRWCRGGPALPTRNTRRGCHGGTQLPAWACSESEQGRQSPWPEGGGVGWG